MKKIYWTPDNNKQTKLIISQIENKNHICFSYKSLQNEKILTVSNNTVNILKETYWLKYLENNIQNKNSFNFVIFIKLKEFYSIYTMINWIISHYWKLQISKTSENNIQNFLNLIESENLYHMINKVLCNFIADCSISKDYLKEFLIEEKDLKQENKLQIENSNLEKVIELQRTKEKEYNKKLKFLDNANITLAIAGLSWSIRWIFFAPFVSVLFISLWIGWINRYIQTKIWKKKSILNIALNTYVSLEDYCDNLIWKNIIDPLQNEDILSQFINLFIENQKFTLIDILNYSKSIEKKYFNNLNKRELRDFYEIINPLRMNIEI